nr:MAG TPA: hypothetical protein [Caudoviricetes sp.]
MNINHPIIKKIQCYIVNNIIIARKSTPDKRFWKFLIYIFSTKSSTTSPK